MYNVCTYIHTYVHKHSYILTQFIAPNKMAYPAMHEHYAGIIVSDFITATQAMVSVVDHLYSESN